MVMISLLNLPLSLPPEAPARKAGLESFLDGLPEYMSRCKCHINATSTTLTRSQARLLREVSLDHHRRKPMEPTPSVRWLV